MTKHSDLIPDYIVAQSLAGLRRLMFMTNAKAGHQFTYFDIQQFDENGKKKWVAWFYRKLATIEELDEE